MMRLINADCLEAMRDIPDGSVDMVLTDPPYGTTACKWDSVIPFAPMWEQLKRITKPNGAIVLTASQPFTSALIMSNVKMFKYCWVWDKVKPSTGLYAKVEKHRRHCGFWEECNFL
jgi:site-specific DNA-methyltransferase (adenine-specific)